MKHKLFRSLILIMIVLVAMAGCTTESQTDTAGATAEKITAEDVKDRMDQESDFIIVDVRTPEEFAEGYIQGAINIPDTEIETTAEGLLSDKSAVIVVYCRSGRRSAIAAKALSELGYSNVYDLGGIVDWPYDLVKGD